jgi:hypothetical protein
MNSRTNGINRLTVSGVLLVVLLSLLRLREPSGRLAEATVATPEAGKTVAARSTKPRKSADSGRFRFMILTVLM